MLTNEPYCKVLPVFLIKYMQSWRARNSFNFSHATVSKISTQIQ